MKRLAAVLLLGASWAQAGDTLPLRQEVTQTGVKAELTLAADSTGQVPLGQPISLRLSLSDELSGEALRGLRPRMWMSRQGGDAAEPCRNQIRRFASGRLAQRADRDLNSFQLLTLNADATVSVINPLLQLNNTKLEALIRLPGVGTDWVHAQSLDRLYITLTERSELAVVDLTTYKLLQTLPLGEGKPRRLVLSPDERTVWVALDDSDKLLAIDAASLEKRAELAIGSGVHALAISPDGQRLVASSSAAGRISVIDAPAARLLGSVDASGTPLAVTISGLARQAYVGSLNAPLLHVIDLASGRRVAQVELPAPVSALRADPSGRHVVAVHTGSSTVMAIDAASARLLGSAPSVAQPDQVVFSQRFAFLRGLGSTTVQMLELRALDEGRLALNEVPIFQKLPGAAPQHIGPADLMAPSPEPGAMLLGSATDTALYYYMEGMMAPQGTYATYSRAARALKVIDRSLKETAPGVYTGTVRLERGGLYSLPLLLEQPRVAHCYTLRVDDTGATDDGRRFAIDFEWAEGSAPAVGQSRELRIRLKDARSGEPVRGVRDLQVMALERPGLSQQRQFAREREPGVYVVTQRFPRPGIWRMMVQATSQKLSFDRSPLFDQPVRDAADAGSAPAAAPSTAAPAAPPAASAAPTR